MITSLRLVNFKNFIDETLRVGPFTVLVGENASGKSNIRDAFRFLHGIGRGYTLAEIFGGKHVFGKFEWPGIRGGSAEVVRYGPDSAFEPSAFSIHVELDLGGRRVHYSIRVGFDPGSGAPHVLEEELRDESKSIYTTVRTRARDLWLRLGENDEHLPLSRSQPALTQMHGDNRISVHPSMSELNRFFSAMRFLDLSPELMRDPSPPNVDVLGDFGENLPTVLASICSKPEYRDVLTSWLGELTPMDVKDFDFPQDPKKRVYLVIRETNGRTVSADSASDGTLRFLAILAALLGENPAPLYFFEEIENGVHAKRQRLLLDLIETQTAKRGVQVVTTTHSPDLLTWANDRTFENIFIVYRDEESAYSIIRPLAELPNVRELRKSQGLGRLHTGGWMEDMLAFAEADRREAQEAGE